MNPSLTLAVAAVLACGTAALTTRFVTPSTPEATSSPESSALVAKVAELQQEIENLRTRPAPAVVEATSADPVRREVVGPSDEQVDAAVARWFAANAAKAAAASGTPAAVEARAGLKALRGKAGYWSNVELYKQLFEQGKMQELIDEFEALAEANPKDAQAQMDLGNAYLAWLQMDNSKWQLSGQADQAFDAVLAIDDKHWEARFTKAMSYTFWPDFLGKKKEAIAHFERLVAQQETMPAQPHESNTYVFLGNLLEQRGDAQRARQIWEQGLRRHPNDAELKKRLGL